MPELVPAFFGGERRIAADGATLAAINPATGEAFASVPRCGQADVQIAVAAAEGAFRRWRNLHPTERAARVLAFADSVEADRDRLLRLDVRDNGSPIREMAIDIDIGAKHLRYFAGLALQARGETIATGHDRLNYTLRQPFGVTASIVAFNHPLMFALKTIGAPLVAGNTVIIKPSEHTSLSSVALAEHIEKCFPPGVLSVVTGLGAEAGDALVTHPNVRRIHFIGGDATGRMIQGRAASVAVKTVSLELGGKNPIVIWPDADLEAAIEGALSGMRFNFQGQACGSTSRLLVQKDARHDFVERLTARMQSLRAGMPEDPTTDIGAIVTEAQLTKVLDYIEIGRRDGGRICAGGSRLMGAEFSRGYFMQPTLFTDVAAESRLLKEEIFGPVLSVVDYEDYDDVIRIANGVRYGLTASIYTRDLSVAHRFARDVEAGYVWINDNQRHFLGAPYGGNKDSGIGREEDPSELASYTELKNVNVRF
jgi:betaine-aldehyde dehydrogenase